MNEPASDDQELDTASSIGPANPPQRRSVAVEYSVIVGATLLLFTLPTLANRLQYGPISFRDLPLNLIEALHLAGTMGGFALLIGYVIHARGVGWRRLGLGRARARRSILEGLALAAAILAFDTLWLLGSGEPLTPVMRLRDHRTPWLILLLAWLVAFVLNSVGEEVLRAYVIRRGEDLGWSTLYAAFISVLLFFSYHTYYVHNELLLVTLTGGVAMTAYYVARRDLLALIIAHTALNCVWILTAL